MHVWIPPPANSFQHDHLPTDTDDDSAGNTRLWAGTTNAADTGVERKVRGNNSAGGWTPGSGDNTHQVPYRPRSMLWPDRQPANSPVRRDMSRSTDPAEAESDGDTGG